MGASEPQVLTGERAWGQQWNKSEQPGARRNQMSKARREAKGRALASPTPAPAETTEPTHPAWTVYTDQQQKSQLTPTQKPMAPRAASACVQLQTDIQGPSGALQLHYLHSLINPSGTPAALDVSHLHAFTHSVPCALPSLSAQVVPAAPSGLAVQHFLAHSASPKDSCSSLQCHCKNPPARWSRTLGEAASPPELCGAVLGSQQVHT